MPLTLQAEDVQAPTPAADPLSLWHLLSLDAPTVAAIWLYFVSRALHHALEYRVVAAMFVAVWMLYAADRLLDGLFGDPSGSRLEPRHLFHLRHRTGFAVGILLAAAALGPLLLAIPWDLLSVYLLLAVLLVLWFTLIHLVASARADVLPKELTPGLFFASAVFAPSFLSHTQRVGWIVAAAACFALLCTVNCLSIYAWEHPGRRLNAHATTRLGVQSLGALQILAIAIPLCLLPLAPPELVAVFAAASLGGALLRLLHSQRRRFGAVQLRAAADLVLLTPLLVVPLLH